MTEWRDVVGYEGSYEVSDDGQVRSVDRIIQTRNRWGECGRRFPSRILKPFLSRQGYVRVALSEGAAGHTKRTVHSLVAEAFIGPRPEGLQVCHNDGDKSNNRPSNLRYDTGSNNVRDSVRHGTQVEARKTHCAQGHPYDEANTKWIRTATGKGRHCRTCHRERRMAYYYRNKAS